MTIQDLIKYKVEIKVLNPQYADYYFSEYKYHHPRLHIAFRGLRIGDKYTYHIDLPIYHMWYCTKASE